MRRLLPALALLAGALAACSGQDNVSPTGTPDPADAGGASLEELCPQVEDSYPTDVGPDVTAPGARASYAEHAGEVRDLLEDADDDATDALESYLEAVEYAAEEHPEEIVPVIAVEERLDAAIPALRDDCADAGTEVFAG